ncbi:unnamed protein product [Caenorhabditis bovis]|uniref:LRRCT domain-containing protein n=1 Tax=Caenorhabditis bovis TaxID=2654633 RepID=A0A8S1EWI9_9PELO|nr:unnamed protein product [Caenorhabditis bovis]
MSGAVRAGLLICAVIAIAESQYDNCFDVESTIKRILDPNDTTVCICAYNGATVVKGMDLTFTQTSVQTLIDSFDALNGTKFGRIRIKNSSLNELPEDIFEIVEPQELILDTCELKHLRVSPMGNSAQYLKKLIVRNNTIHRVERGFFAGMKNLYRLDLSNNDISLIDADSFQDLRELRELFINRNFISDIEDFTFSKLKHLRQLVMLDNTLKSIKKNTFAGLDNVEMLVLNSNQLNEIDWTAFSNMKKLSELNLGKNKISKVELKGLPQLQKLYVPDNQVKAMKNVMLRDLPSLSLLALDKNGIKSLGAIAFQGLSKSIGLATLSLASNNISQISHRTFTVLRNLKTLALQENEIQNLTVDEISFLAPLKKLKNLFLSNNKLTTIRINELPNSLVQLSLDHNLINRIEPKAFDGLSLKRLYINKNKIQFLYHGAFDGMTPDNLEAIDVSSNPWQCVCRNAAEWLPRWLEEAEEADVSEGPLGCLAIPGCGKKEGEQKLKPGEQETPEWITVSATILAAISLILLLAIVILYFKDIAPPKLIRAHRADSDLHKLIENDNLSNFADSCIMVTPMLKKPNSTSNGEKKKVRFEEN